MKAKEAAADGERQEKNEKRMAEKNKLVFVPSKKQMMRSPPPRLREARKTEILEDNEIDMLKYLGVNLQEKEAADDLKIKRRQSV